MWTNVYTKYISIVDFVQKKLVLSLWRDRAHSPSPAVVLIFASKSLPLGHVLLQTPQAGGNWLFLVVDADDAPVPLLDCSILDVLGVHGEVEEQSWHPDVAAGCVDHEEFIFLLVVGNNWGVVARAPSIDSGAAKVDGDGDLLFETVSDNCPEVVLILDLVSAVLLNIEPAVELFVGLVEPGVHLQETAEAHPDLSFAPFLPDRLLADDPLLIVLLILGDIFEHEGGRGDSTGRGVLLFLKVHWEVLTDLCGVHQKVASLK